MPHLLEAFVFLLLEGTCHDIRAKSVSNGFHVDLTQVYSMHDWSHTILSSWYRYDTYQILPAAKRERLSWAMKFKEMCYRAFSVDAVFTSLEKWHPDTGLRHADSFQESLKRLQDFLEEHCHSPSWREVYDRPYMKDDDQVMIMFITGRLKTSPDTLLVAVLILQCWM